MTATEAERNRRRGLTPWWRVRSWSKDLDTLIRLHKGLRALDGDPGAQQAPPSAPALLPAPAELLAPPQDGVTQQETDLPTDASGQEAPVQEAPVREAPVQEMTARQLHSPEAQPPQTPTDTQSPVPEDAVAGPDPAIAAIKETFRYVADAGDKAVGFFYGQLFLRRPQLRQLFPPAMDEQRDRLFHALGRIVESLATPDEMAAYLSQLGRDHRKYRVEPEMY